MFRNEAAEAIYRRQDQDGVEADLARFFGPRADVYLRAYERRRAGVLAGRRWTIGWNWPVFWTWFLWFAWRKLYLEALVALALPALVGEALGEAGSIAVYLLLCLYATPAYLRRALRAVAGADAQALDGEARAAFLRRAGGVSWMGAAAGLVTLVATCIAWMEWRLPDILDQIDAWGLLPPQ